jgi:hypothetical protein
MPVNIAAKFRLPAQPIKLNAAPVGRVRGFRIWADLKNWQGADIVLGDPSDRQMVRSGGPGVLAEHALGFSAICRLGQHGV